MNREGGNIYITVGRYRDTQHRPSLAMMQCWDCWGMPGPRRRFVESSSGETICGLAAESLIMSHQKSGHKRGEEGGSPASCISQHPWPGAGGCWSWSPSCRHLRASDNSLLVTGMRDRQFGQFWAKFFILVWFPELLTGMGGGRGNAAFLQNRKQKIWRTRII